MNSYPAIENHGLIGDLQTAALVASDGTIDWFCAPRFDSPAIFSSLLDRQKGGHFRVTPVGTDYVATQLYLPGTPILITRFLSADGVGEVTDFMPVTGDKVTDRHRLVRMIRVVRGEMRFELDCQPRFNFGRDSHETELFDDGVQFRTSSMTMNVSAARHGALAASGDVEQAGDGVQIQQTLSVGDTGGMVLETAPGAAPHAVTPEAIERLHEQTREHWRTWVGKSRYTGRWREQVERSAMTLKLMTYAPSGALVAAPTAALPEQVGGERNWDYRFTWIRDASLSVYALLGLGFTDEAGAFLRWLNARIHESSAQRQPLQIMYRIDGAADLPEETLDHYEGYKGSSPVRIGNGAANQVQWDIYGEALNAIDLADRSGLAVGHDGWNHLAGIIDWLCEHWDAPEDGIWETRGGQQEFVYGKVMTWVAFDRAIRLAERRGRPADTGRWTNMRDMVYRQVMDRGFDEKRQAFVQHYDTDVLDASLLYMPLVGFIQPTDPRWQSTLRAMDEELVSDSLVYRYNPSASPDGLRGSEGTFSMCSYWYVDALARSGRLEDARVAFEKMLTYSNHVGLYSEEIGPSGEQIGNFPQAFSHLALISAAINLDYQLDHGAGNVDAVVSQS